MKSYSVAEIAGWVDGVVRGDGDVRISGVNGVSEASGTEITWLSDDRYRQALEASSAGAVVVRKGYGETAMPAVLVDDPALAMVEILSRFSPPVPRPAVGVHETALVDDSVELGADVAIGPYVVVGPRTRLGARCVVHAGVHIGADVVVGDDCELWDGVVVRQRCVLGNRVILHPNTVIGADGYGYHFANGRHVKIPQIGTVEIGDDVEIGANSTVDRAKFGVTRVGAGTKIDNLVQVAHNVEIGECCLIVAQCGIAGSTELGRGVVLGGQVGVSDHLRIGDGVQVAAGSLIMKDVPAGIAMGGSPAVPLRQSMRQILAVQRLPDLAAQIKTLTKRVDRLESSTND